MSRIFFPTKLSIAERLFLPSVKTLKKVACHDPSSSEGKLGAEHRLVKAFLNQGPNLSSRMQCLFLIVEISQKTDQKHICYSPGLKKKYFSHLSISHPSLLFPVSTSSPVATFSNPGTSPLFRNRPSSKDEMKVK